MFICFHQCPARGNEQSTKHPRNDISAGGPKRNGANSLDVAIKPRRSVVGCLPADPRNVLYEIRSVLLDINFKAYLSTPTSRKLEGKWTSMAICRSSTLSIRTICPAGGRYLQSSLSQTSPMTCWKPEHSSSHKHIEWRWMKTARPVIDDRNTYIWYPPKTYLSSKFSGIYSNVVLNILNSKTEGIFDDQTLQMFASLFPSHPSLSTSDSRFKTQKRLLESKGV